MLSGENDGNNAVVEINAGAGGVDAADWAQMLVRMIVRYAQRQGWKVDVLDEQPAEEAGIKSATLVVEGPFAYGLLKAETGVHRLVRISPFDGNARRQTSFAAVTITPDVEEDIDVDLDEGDLRIDYYRAGGAGGQHVGADLRAPLDLLALDRGGELGPGLRLAHVVDARAQDAHRL